MTGLLTFQFISTSTGLPVVGPLIGSVFYEANLDPTLSIDVFTILGTSSDAGSNFGLPFTVTGFEPYIRAIPFDPSGNPIVITGLNGFNEAIGEVATTPGLVPEPSTAILFGIGTLILLGCAWSPRRRAGQSDI